MTVLRSMLAVILLTPLFAMAQGGVRIHQIHALGNDTLIQGTWPNSCQPLVREFGRDARGRLDVLLGNDASPCTPGEHPFRLILPQDETFSPAPPPQTAMPVRVYADSDNHGPALVGFALLRDRTTEIQPDSGFWWPLGNEAASGNLLSLERQGNALGIALLSHDDVSGTPVWYFGTSQLEGTTAHARLSRLDDGSSPFFGLNVQPVPRAGMDIDIAFDSASQARVWLNRPSTLEPGTLELTTLSFGRRSFRDTAEHNQWLGSWLLARDIASDEAESGLDWPARLQLDASQTLDIRHVRLIDQDNGYLLDCEHPARQADAAQACTLRDAAGKPMAHFDQIGLDRLDGRDQQGRKLVLLRP